MGDFYVRFEQEFMKEYSDFQQSEEGLALYETHKKQIRIHLLFKEYKNRYFNENSQLGADAKLMLINWENNDPATIALWKK